jgi:hypothetical protein
VLSPRFPIAENTTNDRITKRISFLRNEINGVSGSPLGSIVTFLTELARELLAEEASTANDDNPTISRSKACGEIFFAKEARALRPDHFRPPYRY